MRRTIGFALLLGIGAALTGCTAGFGERAKYGITFYCPGAGNVDMGDAGVRKGLEQAGYRGQVASLMWTFSFNPILDQALRINAKVGASRLARSIEEYINKFPNGEVNIVGLSAGTGVAIWALEDLKPGYRVNNVVLLASSLSDTYDVSKALRRVSGSIYNYYSPNDVVLTTIMLPFGTIDGVLGGQAAGAVGLHSPGGRVVNIRWRPDFEQLGYAGGHTDSTSPAFVRHELSKYIVTLSSAGLTDTAAARRLVRVLQGGHPDRPQLAEKPTQPEWTHPFPPPPTHSIPAPTVAASCDVVETPAVQSGRM